jgi:hypothetical protein
MGPVRTHPTLARSASFDVALYFVRPKGAATKQPRATPGVAFAKCSTEPCKGDTSPVGLLRPFRAFSSFFGSFASSGRCPGLICPAPSGPKPQTEQPQKAPARGSGLCHVELKSFNLMLRIGVRSATGEGMNKIPRWRFDVRSATGERMNKIPRRRFGLA